MHTGEFEIHVTMRLPSADLVGLEALGRRLGCRCLSIELSRGRTVHQPMLTRRVRSSWNAARREAASIACAARRAGFAVSRIKIETDIDHPSVPGDAAAARVQVGYFEHHVRLRLRADANLARLGCLVEPLTAHLSRNARRAMIAGVHERFVTQRCLGVDRAEAGRRLERLLAVLTSEGLDVVDHAREYVVHDGRLALDDGWLYNNGDAETGGA